MAWTCRTCKKNITNRRAEHCPVCHETFAGTTAGDMHRVGRHGVDEGPDRRRCLTPAEIEAKGMGQDSNGYWTSGHTPRFAPNSSSE